MARFADTRDNYAALSFEDQLDHICEIVRQRIDHFKDRVCLGLEHTAGRANNGKIIWLGHWASSLGHLLAAYAVLVTGTNKNKLMPRVEAKAVWLCARLKEECTRAGKIDRNCNILGLKADACVDSPSGKAGPDG